MNAPPARSVRFTLRHATADAHQAVEAGFSRLDLCQIDDYRTFLSSLAAAFVPLERALEATGIDRFLPDWPQRRRRDLLTQDLADLGVTVVALAIPPLPNGATALPGTAYVLEGSRPGGRAILSAPGPDTDPRVRAATRFHAPDPSPTIRGCGHRCWRRWIATCPTMPRATSAADAANVAFACFGRARQVTSKPPRRDTRPCLIPRFTSAMST